MGDLQGKYLEYALGAVYNRNNMVLAEELGTIVSEHEEEEVYRSYYHFDEGRVQHAQKKRTTKAFVGELYVKDVIFDYDGPDALNAARTLYNKLVGLSVPPEWIQPWFSGNKGYHIHIPNVFGFKDGRFVHQDVRSTLSSFAPGVDLAPVSKTGLIRAPWSYHKKSGLRKVYLDPKFFLSEPEEKHRAYADTTRDLAVWEPPLMPEEDELVFPLEDFVRVVPEKEISTGKAFAQKSTVYMGCMQKLFARGPVKGRRNQDLLRLITSWRSRGFGSEECIHLGWKWVEGTEGVTRYDVIQRVQWVFENAANHYSCTTDPTMLEFCIGAQCPLYKYRTREQQATTMKDALSLYKESVTADHGGFNLSDVYPSVNYSIRRNEIILLLADTKIGKSTLFLNWALQMDKKILNFSPEMDIPSMVERSLQIKYGLRVNDGKDLNEVRELAINGNGSFDKMLEGIEHMEFITTKPSLTSIRKLIAEKDPDIVIIDPLEMVETEQKDPDGKLLADGIRAIANDTNTILLVVHHINKAGQKDGKGGTQIQSWMAKGYKRVQEQVDHVLAFEGSHDNPYRTLRRIMGRRPQDLHLSLKGDKETFQFKYQDPIMSFGGR